ncbi:MAG: hypothetical protein HUU55_21405 [Myxococcales bacterium]|nr:hypothetical protein [Myxococcales bacterium]
MRSCQSTYAFVSAMLACVLFAGACSDDESSGTKESCTPGEKVCEGGIPQQCNQDGSAWTPLAACESSHTCFEGECIPPADTDTAGGDVTDDQCSADEDCAGQVTLGVCQRAICDDGLCGVIVSVDGTACTNGTCVVGVCKPVVCQPNALVCGDTVGGDAGVVYQCDAWGTGANTTGTVCDDGDGCNGVEACVSGGCVPGEVAPCTDANPCTTDVCDPITGCTFTNNNDPCDDGDDCTTGDICGGGACIPGTAVVCDDSDPCVTNVCVQGQGCVATPGAPGMPCDDGDACTTGETCQDEGCTGGTAVTCPDPGMCQIAVCDPASGCTTPANVADGTVCDDGLACTEGDACIAGVCGGSPVVCGDDGECGSSECVEVQGGCVTTPIEGPCDDGDPCSSDDICVNGVCTPGALTVSQACGAPQDAACALSGAVGTKVICKLHLARGSETSDVPAAYQFTLTWEPTIAAAVTFQDEFCTPAGCVDVPVPPASLQPTGHQLQTFPTPVSTWAGVGNVIVTNLANPLSALSDAYVDVDGTIVGDSVWVDLIFEMSKDVSASSPVYVTYSKLVAATPDAKAMDVTTEWGVVVTTK